MDGVHQYCTVLILKMSSTQYSTGLLYGLINSIMLIPITISFCTIIYQHAAYEHYMPQLIKIVLFSSIIHQLAFSYCSSLPFAIGQVQDAGLIFLSAMASSIAESCHDQRHIVPTTLVVLSICTFILGSNSSSCSSSSRSRSSSIFIVQYNFMHFISCSINDACSRE